jgi:hypothetical protein
MDYFKAVAATLLFCYSTYLIYDLFANGFSWIVLGFCIGGYIVTHYLWPKDHDIDHRIVDYIELVIELPFRTMALAVRSIGRVVRSGDTDINIDL